MKNVLLALAVSLMSVSAFSFETPDVSQCECPVCGPAKVQECKDKLIDDARITQEKTSEAAKKSPTAINSGDQKSE